ncbi:MAG: hypothetical protein ACP5O3_02575 [Candidatus Micrarchaeia archaeon]
MQQNLFLLPLMPWGVGAMSEAEAIGYCTAIAIALYLFFKHVASRTRATTA